VTLSSGIGGYAAPGLVVAVVMVGILQLLKRYNGEIIRMILSQ
jgi:hypothetical protein